MTSFASCITICICIQVYHCCLPSRVDKGETTYTYTYTCTRGAGRRLSDVVAQQPHERGAKTDHLHNVNISWDIHHEIKSHDMNDTTLKHVAPHDAFAFLGKTRHLFIYSLGGSAPVSIRSRLPHHPRLAWSCAEITNTQGYAVYIFSCMVPNICVLP